MHDLQLAAAHFDAVAVLHDGAVHAVGQPADVLTPATVHDVFDVPATQLTDPATGRVHLVLGPGAPVPAPRKVPA
uniref:Uncharacterized protein n=1 Tax=Janibacter limosus TaxID=53458 RepID=A0AC61U8V4_9MICO|nr:hypothetical protein [Janibacter limosus]